jgi:glycosyltransferase involved in cell wall biosynthesis
MPEVQPAGVRDAYPRVSVIVAVKNGERYLREALESVLAQSYPPHEIIVVDGRSTDQTEQIARSFRQVVFIRQRGQGIADAYNCGIDSACGEIIAFLSHDDRWTPDKLSVQVNHLLEHPEVQYTIARVKFFLENESVVPAGFRPQLLDGDHAGWIMETLVVRRSLFERIGRFNPELKTAEDVDWFSRAKDHQIPMALVPQVLLRKRVHEASLSLSDVDKNNQRLLAVLRQSIQRKRQ